MDWKTTEVQLLRDNFPVLGVTGCSLLLPGHSLSAIQTKARDLGIKTLKRRIGDQLLVALMQLADAVRRNDTGMISQALAQADIAINRSRRKK